MYKTMAISPRQFAACRKGTAPGQVLLWLPVPLQMHLTHHPEKMVQSQGRAPHTPEDEYPFALF